MNGLPCLSFGKGPPLIVLTFTSEAAEPKGLERWYTMRVIRPLDEHFTIHLLNRSPGLPPTTTMAELAAHYAGAIQTLGGPVNVLGISTGGSLALQLAADRPELVDRMALGGTAYSLGPVGRRAQRAFIDRARRGARPTPALAENVTGSAIGQFLFKGMAWLMDGRKDHTDAATMLNAEDGFDIRDRLHEIQAPTLLIQGEKDIPYPLEMARQTVEGISDARLTVYPGRGHGGTFTAKRFAADVLAFLTDHSQPLRRKPR